jgi:hypothetical protein
MVSLKLKSGSKVEVMRGSVDVVGGCVVLYDKPADGDDTLVVAYCLLPGETVRRDGVKGDYVVEF